MTEENVIDTTGETVEDSDYPEDDCAHNHLNYGATDNEGRVLCNTCGVYVSTHDTEVGSSAEFKAAEDALALLPGSSFNCKDDNHDLDQGRVASDGGVFCRLCESYVGGLTPEEAKLTEKQQKANRMIELHALIVQKKNEIQDHYHEIRSIGHFESEDEAKAWLVENGFKWSESENGVVVTSPRGQWHRSPSLMDAASHARSSIESQAV